MLIEEQIAARQLRARKEVFKIEGQGRGVFGDYQVFSPATKRSYRVKKRAQLDPFSMGALAEFERALIVERTRAGMVAARMRGTHVGRQPKLTDRQIITALRLTGPGNRTLDEVAGKYGVERSTLFKAMKRFKKSWKE